MGFLDKAKKLAEQGQAKLDEAQKNINKGHQQQPGAGGPIVEYDNHGRPIQSAPLAADAAVPAAATTPAVPPTADSAPVVSSGPVLDPDAPAAPGVPDTAAAPSAPAAPAAAPPGPTRPEDRNKPSNEPPKMSSGDPLAG